MNNHAIVQAADLLLQHRQALRPFAGFPRECLPQNEEDAYDVQAALLRKLEAASGDRQVGYKIGSTTPVMQEYLQIDHPCSGGILSGGVHNAPAEFPHASFVRVGVEGELAVRLSRDLPESGTPYTVETVSDAVGECMTAIEVVEDRNVNFRDLDTPTLIADNYFHAASVLGTPVSEWRTLDLMNIQGTLKINGEVTGTGKGQDVRGCPLAAVSWLANSLILRGQHLRQGDLISTGSIVEVRWVNLGDEVSFELEGLEPVSVRFS